MDLSKALKEAKERATQALRLGAHLTNPLEVAIERRAYEHENERLRVALATTLSRSDTPAAAARVEIARDRLEALRARQEDERAAKRVKTTQQRIAAMSANQAAGALQGIR